MKVITSVLVYYLLGLHWMPPSIARTSSSEVLRCLRGLEKWLFYSCGVDAQTLTASESQSSIMNVPR